MGGVKFVMVMILLGVEMLMVVFGMFKFCGDVCCDVVWEVLMVGFRVVDTASCYRNEDVVVDVLKSVLRNVCDEMWIMMKLVLDEMMSEEVINCVIDGMVAWLGRASDLLFVYWFGRSKAAFESDVYGEVCKRMW